MIAVSLSAAEACGGETGAWTVDPSVGIHGETSKCIKRNRWKSRHNKMFVLEVIMTALALCQTVQGHPQTRQLLSFQSRPRQHDSPTLSSSSSSLLTEGEELTYLQWIEEEDEEEELRKQQQQQQQQQPSPKPPRRWVWTGRVEDQSYRPSDDVNRRTVSHRPAPHPLRMKEWTVSLSWKEQNQSRPSRMEYEFDANGYVRCRHPNRVPDHKKDVEENSQPSDPRWWRITKKNDHNDDPDYLVGTWKLVPSGITWHLSWNGRSYWFYADLQVNPFGPYPKMFRGLVIGDRSSPRNHEDNEKTPGILPRRPRRWLRPVVATFSGRGTGVDTADFTYQGRGPPKQ